MQLKLSTEDNAEYDRIYAIHRARKDAAVASGDMVAAKKARQAISVLYNRYKQRALPDETTDQPHAMTLEERITRIEQHLNLN